MCRLPSDYDGRDRVLEDEVLFVIGFQNDRILIESTNTASQFTTAQQVNRNARMFLAGSIEENLLYVLRWRLFHLSLIAFFLGAH